MQKFLGIIVLGLSLVAIGLVNGSIPNPNPLQQIAGYKQWTRVSSGIAKVMPLDMSSIGG